MPWLLPGRSWIDPIPGLSHGNTKGREVAEGQGELGLGPGCRVGPGRMGARGVSGSPKDPANLPPFKET